MSVLPTDDDTLKVIDSEFHRQGSPMKRAELGIHSNSAFARLLTDSIMVKIETAADPGSPRWRVAARHAAMVAYHELQERLPGGDFGFFFAPSHPNYRTPDETATESAPLPSGSEISSLRAAL